jgi:hypothetical protein
MTTATKSVDIRATPSDIPPSRPVSRWIAAAVLVGGSTLQLVEEMIEPPFADDGQRFAWLATHTTLHSIDIAIGLSAIPLLIAAALLLARLSWKMPRLARIGAACNVVGLCGLAAVHGFEAATIAVLDAHVPAATVAAAAANVQPALAIPLGIMFLGVLTVGVPMMLIALWRSRTVPRGAIVVAFGFMALDFYGPEIPFPAHGLLFISYVWMAASLAFGRRRLIEPAPEPSRGY